MNYLDVLFSCLVLSHWLAPLPRTPKQVWEHRAGYWWCGYGSAGMGYAELMKT